MNEEWMKKKIADKVCWVRREDQLLVIAFVRIIFHHITSVLNKIKNAQNIQFFE